MNDIWREFEDRLVLELSKYHNIENIALVMDGNRRYARALKFIDMRSGHIAGSNTFKKAIEWSCLAGIKSIGAFAFSIENFKRSKSEVDFLMDLARTQLSELFHMYLI